MEETVKPIFDWNGNRFQVIITMEEALKTLPNRFKIELLKMFASEEEMQRSMQELIFDDEGCLSLMHYYIEKQEPMITFDSMVAGMKDLTTLDKFRDAFWAAIVNFSGPLKKQVLMQIWIQFKQELKTVQLPSSTTNASFLSGKPEQD